MAACSAFRPLLCLLALSQNVIAVRESIRAQKRSEKSRFLMDGECSVVCDSNLTGFCVDQGACSTINGEESSDSVETLKILTGTWGGWIEPVAKAFSESRSDVNVELVVVEMQDLSPDIINEARSKTGLFDGFLTPPGVMGSIVEEEGWADLKPYINSSPERLAEWTDIKLGYRQQIAHYQDAILMFPSDGDLLHLFYNAEILQHFGLDVPRTWEEYAHVAKEVHGKQYNGKVLTGSCVGRVEGCAGAYWANLLLSSMTQTSGTSQGHLFDPTTMKALLGPACTTALKHMEEHVQYGHEEEFDHCIELNEDSLRKGECALHYNWGNTYATYLLEGSVLGNGKMGVAKPPGSTLVLDRETMTLEECDEKRCPYATHYDDIGWVNHPSYLAFAGWSCAVNNYTTPYKKQLTMDFCAFTASKNVSRDFIVRNASSAIGGPDPFRKSHLDEELFVSRGYDRETTQLYIKSVEEGLGSMNAVVDDRFPLSSEIYALLDSFFYNHLKAFREGKIVGHLPALRQQGCDALEEEWAELIRKRDSKANTRVSTLEAYQKLRGVYTVQVDLNQLNRGIRAYGFAIAGVALLSSVGFAAWAIIFRETRVVKASQPTFLVLICIGTFIFGSSIFPMSIDDGIATQSTCSTACMIIPWFVALGWTVLFSALYAKLRRVNLVCRNAMHFKRQSVTIADVMLPFAILFTANLALLLIWTLTDPMYWERRNISETESYGTCAANNDSAVWKVCIALLGLLNGTALILANVEAYKARHISTEYGESTYISLAMASMLQVFLVGIPLLFLVQDNSTARFFANSSVAFIVCMSVLLLLFVPKVFLWYKQRQIEANSNRRGARSPHSNPATMLSRPPEVESLRLRLRAMSEKVKTLSRILQENHGVEDTQYYFEQAGIDDDDIYADEYSTVVHDNGVSTFKRTGSGKSSGNSALGGGRVAPSSNFTNAALGDRWASSMVPYHNTTSIGATSQQSQNEATTFVSTREQAPPRQFAADSSAVVVDDDAGQPPDQPQLHHQHTVHDPFEDAAAPEAEATTAVPPPAEEPESQRNLADQPSLS